jgi:hypothetical protein
MLRFQRKETYRWHLSVLERVNDAVDLEFAVDIGLFLLNVGRFVYTSHVVGV